VFTYTKVRRLNVKQYLIYQLFTATVHKGMLSVGGQMHTNGTTTFSLDAVLISAETAVWF
jgi:hypothetical protein